MIEQNDLYIPPHVLREPLGGEAIRLILRKCGQFKVGEFYRRKDIGAVIAKELARHGAEKPTDKDASLAFKSVFSRATKSVAEALRISFKYVESSDYAPGAWGWYQFVGGTDTAVAVDVAEVAALDPTRRYGDGKCCVYAWFLPLYARQGKERWPIKIGHSSGVPSSRFNQFEAMLPEKIHLAVEWFCKTKKDAEDREKNLHRMLANCRIEDLTGKEWYETNPKEICENIDKLRIAFP